MPTFDFKCRNRHVTEELVPSNVMSIQCPKCEQIAEKVYLVAPKLSWLNMGASKNASPEAIAKFDKMHRDRKAKEDKIYETHGDYGPAAGA